MENYNQIFLELEESSIYKPSEVTSELLKKYPELGNEIILPINMQDDNKEIPVFIFSQNPFFQIQGNFYNVIITVSEKFKDIFKNIIENVFNIFNKIKINFVGIACNYQNRIIEKKITSFKMNFFNNYDTIDKDEIHFSMIREIIINNKKTRCLEGYSTLNNSFVSHFEFNMKRKDFHILNIEYIISFVDNSINYMEERLKCF